MYMLRITNFLQTIRSRSSRKSIPRMRSSVLLSPVSLLPSCSAAPRLTGQQLWSWPERTLFASTTRTVRLWGLSAWRSAQTRPLRSAQVQSVWLDMTWPRMLRTGRWKKQVCGERTWMLWSCMIIFLPKDSSPTTPDKETDIVSCVSQTRLVTLWTEGQHILWEMRCQSQWWTYL